MQEPSSSGTNAPAEPASIQPLSMPEGLPAAPFSPVPGWLAFTVRPANQQKDAWTPAHPNATAVIVNAEPWSETVEEGTRFRLLAREGNLPLTLSEVSELPYGCDGNTTTMAAFRTPHDLAEQVVWILPENMQSSRAIPVVTGERTRTRRTWTVGAFAVTLEARGERKAHLRLARGDKELHARDVEKPMMEGASVEGFDLANEREIGMPVPQAAFDIEGRFTALVLRTLSYEGVHFDVIALGEQAQEAGNQYVYLCAF